MRCPRCQFENIPGHAACFRCGSVLEAKAGSVEVHPPRAPGWKKPFRLAARWMRHRRTARTVEGLAKRAAGRMTQFAAAHAPELGLPRSVRKSPWVALRRSMGQMLSGLALSIVPGLAHLVRGEFRTIYLYVISWIAALAQALLFYGSSLGVAAVSVAVVLHAWIAMDAVLVSKQIKEEMTALSKMSWRLGGLAGLSVLIFLMYWQVRAVGGFTTGESGIAVPALQVELRDSILCRRLNARPAPPPLKHGNLVLVRVRAIGRGDQYGGGGMGDFIGETVGQIVGLPGDKVALTPVSWVVNGRALDQQKFPVPSSIQGQSFSVTLGKTEYFVTMELSVQAAGNVPASGLTAGMLVHDRSEIVARGFMRWFPLKKRGWLEELE